MRVRFTEQLQRALPEKFQGHLELKLSESVLRSHWHLLHAGPKSLIWNDQTEKVLKVYWSGGPRRLESIAQSHESACRDHPDLLPQSRCVGTGKLIPEGPELLFMEQERVTVCPPRYEFAPREWEDILQKWDTLIARHTLPVPPETQWLIERLQRDDEAAHHEMGRRYFDGLASVQAPLALRRLRGVFADAPGLAQPELSQLSKILGDLSPKHALVASPWLAFDLEKYGPGDPAKDLSTIVRFYLYRHDATNAERVLRYLRDRYNDPGLIYRVYLATLGSGSRLLSTPAPERSLLERYRLVLAFYEVAEKYFA